MTFYKALDARGRSTHGGSFQWSLPSGDGPGDWTPTINDVAICERGYHVVNLSGLLGWIAPRIFVAEMRGARVRQVHKWAVSAVRLVRETAWTERSARLFAADCAERVLPIFERARPGDDRPRRAIAAARAYARGKIDAAVSAAAWDAARAAARADARAAVSAALSAAVRDAVRDAASAAVSAAAWDASRDAAWDAARAAERQWQVRRLRRYLVGELG